MPRVRQRNIAIAGAVSQVEEYVKLEQRLVLAAWVCQKLGYNSNKAMFEALKDVDEGFDGMGRSYLVQAIASRGSKCQITLEDLERYDANVKDHLAYFNKHRKEVLTLRYFQHLSLIISEFFLDRLFNHGQQLRVELNQFVVQRNSKRGPLEPQDPEFINGDLTKLAFWMATGSGKTILMHFHYRQYLHYCSDALDNILLVTPDEGLSQQHIEHMQASGIPCERFSLNDSGFEAVKRNVVRVIEITKLVEEKKGSGVSVPVEAFDGRNLIFVDEGHRGASSEANKWLGYRQKLAQTGFTFEYSATFGQAMTAARDEDMTKEYGKAILFDYSYKYFYGDGFGKDFNVLNLRQETTEEQTRTLLLANLLAFHEQKRAFQTKSNEMLKYHLADPLWIFVGSTVNTTNQAQGSDVLTVIKFLDSFLRNERQWVKKWIRKILTADSGIADDAGNDVFVARFKMLKSWQKDPNVILRDIMKRIFHSSHGGRLHVGDIKGKAGELGLKVSGSDYYFGMVYIGDTSTFKQLIEDKCPDVEVEDDQIGEGLFENIKKPDSRINILVGAKKFMQGWDSWRVTNMGLLNIGRSEGSEIIQLFGRGVRLKGLNRCLKRSAALSGSHPTGIELLERLNIFAIRANYMTQFREYLEREGIEPLGDMELALPIRRESVFLKKGLIAPRLPTESRFADDDKIILDIDPAAKVVLNFSVQVERIGTQAGAFQTAKYIGGVERWASPAQLKWLDWEDLYLDMLSYKEERGFHNLVIRPEHPRAILEASDPKLYALICDESVLDPKTSAQVLILQTVMAGVLKKYVERFYRKRQQRWDSKHMVYAPLDKYDDNFQDYILKVPRSDTALLQTIQTAIADWKRVQKTLSSDIPNIHFDRHLFQPLLISKGSSKVRCAPPSLNPSEERLVHDLKAFCIGNPDALVGKELFLLRNLSRGKGIGFFEDNGFFPDFMLWITEGKKQRLIFIEPHGMLLEDHPTINPKVGLYKKLQSEAIQTKKALKKNLTLDSFIISATPFDDLRTRHGSEWDRNKYAGEHILFFGDQPDDCAYIAQILSENAGVASPATVPEKASVLAQILTSVKESLKFKEYLPVYSFAAACGKFGHDQTAQEEGWIKVDIKRVLHPEMFVVKAVGQSMEPKINDGDYCAFEKDRGGTRNDKIVLVECRDSVDPDSGKYTIKKYLSEKIEGADEVMIQQRINLIPLNKKYKTIVLELGDGDGFTVVGWHVEVVGRAK